MTATIRAAYCRPAWQQLIYAKLSTHRRAHAVERARALGLLAPSARKR